MLFRKDKNITQGKAEIIYIRCPKCNKNHGKTIPMYIIDIKRSWQDLVYQKELVNAQEINMCCGIELEYYIGNKLAREIIFK
jgi:hypothetical protein